ncbi:MAG: hypothetical protein IJT88_10490 [Kiritimatiellae bacterium]|nr:hypothetical protein [Kiritimatiellia bacterium]
MPRSRPSPPGSFSYAVMLCDALELMGRIKKLAEARGAGAAARLLCGADGEEAMEAILTEDFPQAVFHNDFMHWRVANAACVCALLARLRSAA